MSNRLKAYSAIIAVSAGSVLTAGSAFAQFAPDAQTGIDDTGGAEGSGDVPALLKIIVNTLLFIVGATSVIMIIISGIRFIFSNGDQQQVSSARNTLLYSVIGLIVAVVAWGIVNFVLNWLYYGTPATPPEDSGSI